MRPPRGWLPAFAVLFIAYQLPEGLGARVLDSGTVAAGLMLAVLPVAWLVARSLGSGFATAYALEWRRGTGGLLLALFAAAAAAKLAALWIGVRAGIYLPTDGGADSASTSGVAFLLAATFVPSIGEDIVTRGFWMRVPGIAWRPAAFVAATTAIYVANHVYRLAAGPAEWAMLAAYGLAYGTAAWRARSLWAALGLHWGWNFAGELAASALPMEVADATMSRALSGGAHLVLLCLVLVLPRRRDQSFLK